MENTEVNDFKIILDKCKTVFVNKLGDYGMSWTVLRLSSLTDQILIKVCRIRSIQQKKQQLVEDSIIDDFIGIINYCVMALIRYDFHDKDFDISEKKVLEKFDLIIKDVLQLIYNKNHDYDEAWKLMRISSIIDIMFMKLKRIKKIENNKGITKYSENIASGYKDLINYSIFCIKKINTT